MIKRPRSGGGWKAIIYSLRLAQRSFDLGESDLSALMRARAASYEAQSWRQRQQVACGLALSRLHQAQGVLP